MVVIGGGIAGASVAYELAADRSVLLLEAEDALGTHSTARSAAVYVPGHGAREVRELVERSGPRFAALADELGTPPLLTPRPVLWVGCDEPGERALVALLAERAGEPDAPATNINECLWAQCPTEYGACWADPSCATLTTCYGQCLTAADPDSCNGACWVAASQYAKYLWMETFVCGLTDLCYADMTKDWWGHASAPDGVARWAEYNGCEGTATEGAPLDLAWDLPGEDTYPSRHDGCPEGVSADLWTIQYGSHYPSFYPAWDAALFDWMLAQYKSAP